MNIAEQAVLEYLTHDGKVFVCPQYRSMGTVPDFVALDFAKSPPQVEIIEVSTAYDLADLAKKVTDSVWIKRLFDKLENDKVIDHAWTRGLRVFVSSAHAPNFSKKIEGFNDVKVETLDHVFECLLDFRKKSV